MTYRVRRLVSLAFCLGLSVLFTRNAHSAEWLTPSERDFFASMGRNVRVHGKTTYDRATIDRWPDIARDAPQPLRGRIQTIIDAKEKSKPTEKEKADYQAYLQNGVNQARGELIRGLFESIVTDDTAGAAINTTNRLMKSAKVTEAWDLQRRWLERGIQARKDADRALDQITGDLERRAGRQRPSSDLPLNLVIDDNELRLEVKSAAGNVSEPLVQVLLHKSKNPGAWTALNATSGLGLQAMGVSNMDGEAQMRGNLLAANQEIAASLPIKSTILLPDVESGQPASISFGLPTRAAIGIERVEAHVWTGDGYFTVSDVPGLAEAKRRAAEQVEKARQEARQRAMMPGRNGINPFVRPTTPPGRGRGVAPPSRAGAGFGQNRQGMTRQNTARPPARPSNTLSQDKLAASSLNQAKLYIKDGKPKLAVPYLNRAIKAAPNSDAGQEAQTLLDEIDK